MNYKQLKEQMKYNPFPKQIACKGTEQKGFISVSRLTRHARDLCLGGSQDSANKLLISLSERQKGEREKTAEEAKGETGGDKFKLQHCVRGGEDRQRCYKGFNESETFTDFFVRVQHQGELQQHCWSPLVEVSLFAALYSVHFKVTTISH